MELSFWEREVYFSGIDVLIVGSGIVGLNTARSLKEQSPELKILVVDRGFLPYGASTRNAGFTCFGSLSELMDDLKTMSEADVFNLVKRRWEGLKRLRSILGDDKIGYEGLGNFEVFTDDDKTIFDECSAKLDYFNQQLEKLTGEKNMYSIADDAIGSFGFDKVTHLIKNKGEGQIDTGKMMQELLKYVRSLGVEIINGIEIEKWENTKNGMHITIKQAFEFDVKKMVVTTNAFAKQLLPHLNVIPGRAQVFITAPIKNLKIRGAFHYDKGYYYFRNIGDRILLGGGRNLDFDKERTAEFGLTDKIQNHLEALLHTMILPDQKVDIEMRWSGIMGLGPVKTTIVEKLDEHLYCAVRMGGMGIAIGSLVGEEAAKLVLE